MTDHEAGNIHEFEPDAPADELETPKKSIAREALWITDAEMIRRLGVPEKIARTAIRSFEADPRSGFPRKSRTWGDRRYWPAVLDFFDRKERPLRKTG